MFIKQALLCLGRAVVIACLISPSFSQNTQARVQTLYDEARSKEQAGDLNAAIEKYQAILKLDPKLAAAFNNLGRLYVRQARYLDAIESLKNALQLDAKLASSHVLMGISLYEMEDYGAARQELTEAVRLDPRDQNAKLYLARSLYELGDWEKASRLLDELSHSDPKNPQILYNLGLVHMKLASSALERLQAVAPDSYLIESVLASTAEAKQQYGIAVEHYKQAVAKAPDARNLHYALGHALYQNGEFKEALTEYRLELQVNPQNYMASWEAARVLLNESPQEAFLLSTRALELNPKLAPAYLIRGRALLELKQPNKAIEDLKKAAALDSNEPTVHYQLARAYRALGLTQQAQQENATFAQMQEAEHSRKGTASPEGQHVRSPAID